MRERHSVVFLHVDILTVLDGPVEASQSENDRVRQPGDDVPPLYLCFLAAVAALYIRDDFAALPVVQGSDNVGRIGTDSELQRKL